MMSLNPRLEKIKNILVCPSCYQALSYQENNACCQACGKNYPICKGKIYFISVPAYNDELDSLKGKLKKLLGKYYYSIGVNVIAPTYPFNYLKEIKRKAAIGRDIIVDLGCGNHRIHPDIIGLDIFGYDAVDLVCDLEHLPFRPDSVDVFASRSVIEHVPNPQGVIQKIHQATKKGGYSIHCVPFLFPFHASPYDFQRYTHKGLDILFQSWKKIEQKNITGPISVMLSNWVEFCALVLSFGFYKLKSYLYLLFCLLFFPLKYLDYFFVGSKNFHSLAASFLMVVQKE